MNTTNWDASRNVFILTAQTTKVMDGKLKEYVGFFKYKDDKLYKLPTDEYIDDE